MPTYAPITVAGEAIEFQPLTEDRLKQFMSYLMPVLHASQADGDQAWLRALHDNAIALAQALALASGRPVEWVSSLPFAEFLDLARALLDAYNSHLEQEIPQRLRLVSPLASEEV